MTAVALAAVPALLVLRGGSDDATAPPATIPAPAAAAQAVELAPPAPVVASPASSATAAVTRFLDAEIDRDLAASLALLGDTERARIGSTEAWTLQHDQMPRMLGYDLVATEGDEVTVRLELEPRLDEVTGFIPARATATFVTERRADGWLVDFDRTELIPELPDEAGATVAAEAWVAARQGCSDAAQYPGSLLGQPDLADTLCNDDGTYTAAGIEALDRFVDPTVIQAAFGPDATDFTRVVQITGPSPLQIVTAPFGEDWMVVAIAAAP